MFIFLCNFVRDSLILWGVNPLTIATTMLQTLSLRKFWLCCLKSSMAIKLHFVFSEKYLPYHLTQSRLKALSFYISLSLFSKCIFYNLSLNGSIWSSDHQPYSLVLRSLTQNFIFGLTFLNVICALLLKGLLHIPFIENENDLDFMIDRIYHEPRKMFQPHLFLKNLNCHLKKWVVVLMFVMMLWKSMKKCIGYGQENTKCKQN